MEGGKRHENGKAYSRTHRRSANLECRIEGILFSFTSLGGNFWSCLIAKYYCWLNLKKPWEAPCQHLQVRRSYIFCRRYTRRNKILNLSNAAIRSFSSGQSTTSTSPSSGSFHHCHRHHHRTKVKSPPKFPLLFCYTPQPANPTSSWTCTYI